MDSDPFSASADSDAADSRALERDETETQCSSQVRDEIIPLPLPCFDYCDLCISLTEQMPSKSFSIEKGLLTERVTATCLDAENELIAVGTNVGNAHIFNRRLRKMFTVKGQDQIVCLKLARNTDYALLAVGLRTGLFMVLQLPSSEEGKSRKLVQKVMTDVHRCKITCMVWSSDGRKLFTGDASGLIMMTILDFENDVLDSNFIYCDSDRLAIVQLAYWGNILSACTVSETFLVDIANDCKVHAIGGRGKKGTSSNCGVTFIPSNSNEDRTRPYLYISRPGHRIWRVNLNDLDKDNDEEVLQITETQDYHHLVSSTRPLSIPIELQDEESTSMEISKTAGFGTLHHMVISENDHQTNVLVSYNDRCLYLMDLERRTIIGRAIFRHPVAGLAVCPNSQEIFILFTGQESSPMILRISPKPADPWLIHSMKRRGSTHSELLNAPAVGVKEILQKLKTSSSQIMTKSADVISMRHLDSSTPNFQVFLNKLRASTGSTGVDAGVVAEDFNIGIGTTSPMSTPDSVSLASGSGSAPPWCLEDQPENSNAVCHIRVTKKKRTGKKSEGRSVQVNAGGTTKSTDAVQSTALNMNEDIPLSTPTEEMYLMNRFNPFDDCTAGETTREQLEALLESSILRMETNLATEQPVNTNCNTILDWSRPGTEDVLEGVAEGISHSVDTSVPTITDSVDSGPISTSFRQLLLSEAVSTPEPHYLTDDRKLELLSSPDDVDVSLGSLSSGYGRDIWCQVIHDRPIIYITGSTHYLAFVDTDQRCRYYSYARNSPDILSMGTKDAWAVLQEKADSLAVSPNGRILWRVLDQVAYAQLRPNVHSPCGRKWCEAGNEVSTKVAVSNVCAWYLKTDGTVCAQTRLRADRPCYKIVHIDSEWPLVQLACTEDVVWGLRHDGRLVVRIGIKLDCPTGEDWIDFVPSGPSEVVALHLYGETAWLIDTEGRLWFCSGITNRYPIGTTGRWWQVSLPTSLNSKSASKRYTLPHAVHVSSFGVHVAVDRSIWYSRGGVTGHRWHNAIPSQWANVAIFRLICASCLVDEVKDHIWLARLNDEFMLYQPKLKRLQSIESPCIDTEVVSLCGALNYVWVLDASGRIFIRCGIDSSICPTGSTWRQLDMTQFESGGSNPVKFISISCSSSSVWACDQYGHVYVRLGVSWSAESELPSAWLRLDDDTSGDDRDSGSKTTTTNKRPRTTVRKLFCASNSASVWALSRTGRVYVREGITKEMPVGKKWLEIEDVKARTLAIGKDKAWMLSEDYVLYQRHGITNTNPAGNFWKAVPCKLQAAAVTPNGALWGLDMEGRLVKHQQKVYSLSCDNTEGGHAGISSNNESTPSSEHFLELSDYEII